MARIELIYFTGCPKYSEAKAALLEAGALGFLEVSQDQLPHGDPRKTYSSPSLVVDGSLVLGYEGDEPSCSLQHWNSEVIRRELLSRVDQPHAAEAPICLLGSGEFQERRKQVREVLRAVHPTVTEREDGYEIQFSKVNQHLSELMELVRLERQCCPSLGFTLRLEPGDTGSLRIFGSAAAKELLTDLLTGLVPAPCCSGGDGAAL